MSIINIKFNSFSFHMKTFITSNDIDMFRTMDNIKKVEYEKFEYKKF